MPTLVYPAVSKASFSSVTATRLKKANMHADMLKKMGKYPNFLHWTPFVTPHAMELISRDAELLNRFERGIKNGSLLTDRILQDFVFDAIRAKSLTIAMFGGELPLFGICGTTRDDLTLFKTMTDEFIKTPALEDVTLFLQSHRIALDAPDDLTIDELKGLLSMDHKGLASLVSTIRVTGGTVSTSLEVSNRVMKVDRRTLSDPTELMLLMGPLGF